MKNNRKELKIAFNHYFSITKKIMSTLSCKNPILKDAFITLYKVKEIVDSDITELSVHEAMYIKSTVKIISYLIDSTLYSLNYDSEKLDLLIQDSVVGLICLYSQLEFIIGE